MLVSPRVDFLCNLRHSLSLALSLKSSGRNLFVVSLRAATLFGVSHFSFLRTFLHLYLLPHLGTGPSSWGVHAG